MTVTTSATIGRSDHNDWVLEDDYVSGSHARIFRRGNRFEIEDRSTNGTGLNDDQLVNDRATLKHGDRLAIGDFLIDVAVHDVQPALSIAESSSPPLRRSIVGESRSTEVVSSESNLGPDTEMLSSGSRGGDEWDSGNSDEWEVSSAPDMDSWDEPGASFSDHADERPIPAAEDQGAARPTTKPRSLRTDDHAAVDAAVIREAVDAALQRQQKEMLVALGLDHDAAAELLRTPDVHLKIAQMLRTAVQGIHKASQARVVCVQELDLGAPGNSIFEREPLTSAGLAGVLIRESARGEDPSRTVQVAMDALVRHQAGLVEGMKNGYECMLDFCRPGFDEEKGSKLLAFYEKARHWEDWVQTFNDKTRIKDQAFRRLFGQHLADGYRKFVRRSDG